MENFYFDLVNRRANHRFSILVRRRVEFFDSLRGFRDLEPWEGEDGGKRSSPAGGSRRRASANSDLHSQLHISLRRKPASPPRKFFRLEDAAPPPLLLRIQTTNPCLLDSAQIYEAPMSKWKSLKNRRLQNWGIVLFLCPPIFPESDRSDGSVFPVGYFLMPIFSPGGVVHEKGLLPQDCESINPASFPSPSTFEIQNCFACGFRNI